jgi:hypothetical protein
MRTALAVAVLAALLPAPGYSQVPQYPWCSVQRDGDGGELVSCGFDSREQCRVTLMGVGGDCRPNARFVAAPKQPAPVPGVLTPPAPREAPAPAVRERKKSQPS